MCGLSNTHIPYKVFTCTYSLYSDKNNYVIIDSCKVIRNPIINPINQDYSHHTIEKIHIIT